MKRGLVSNKDRLLDRSSFHSWLRSEVTFSPLFRNRQHNSAPERIRIRRVIVVPGLLGVGNEGRVAIEQVYYVERQRESLQEAPAGLRPDARGEIDRRP